MSDAWTNATHIRVDGQLGTTLRSDLARGNELLLRPVAGFLGVRLEDQRNAVVVVQALATLAVCQPTKHTALVGRPTHNVSPAQFTPLFSDAGTLAVILRRIEDDASVRITAEAAEDGLWYVSGAPWLDDEDVDVYAFETRHLSEMYAALAYFAYLKEIA
jgi:hypothetical protein